MVVTRDFVWRIGAQKARCAPAETCLAHLARARDVPFWVGDQEESIIINVWFLGAAWDANMWLGTHVFFVCV